MTAENPLSARMVIYSSIANILYAGHEPHSVDTQTGVKEQIMVHDDPHLGLGQLCFIFHLLCSAPMLVKFTYYALKFTYYALKFTYYAPIMPNHSYTANLLFRVIIMNLR